jgi:hypothetical protein
MAYYFKGDLCQISKQGDLLFNYDINVLMSNVYPTVETEEEYKKALSLIWANKCEGWWHYKEDYIKYGICKKSEYVKRLCGKLYLNHMIPDGLIPNWEKWWELIKSQDVKINGIPVKYKKDEKGGTKLIYKGVEADKDNNIEVNLGDKITIVDKEFIII